MYVPDYDTVLTFEIILYYIYIIVGWYLPACVFIYPKVSYPHKSLDYIPQPDDGIAIYTCTATRANVQYHIHTVYTE